MDDPGEDTVQAEVPGDADHGVEQRVQPLLLVEDPLHAIASTSRRRSSELHLTQPAR